MGHLWLLFSKIPNSAVSFWISILRREWSAYVNKGIESGAFIVFITSLEFNHWGKREGTKLHSSHARSTISGSLSMLNWQNLLFLLLRVWEWFDYCAGRSSQVLALEWTRNSSPARVVAATTSFPERTLESKFKRRRIRS